MKAIYQRAFQRISQKLTPAQLSTLHHSTPSIYHLLPRDDLRCLLKIHCKLIKPPSEQMPLIEASKRLRASINASEAKICQICPNKEDCKVSFLPGEIAEKGALDDLMMFLERLGEEQVEEKPRIYVAGIKVLMGLPEIAEMLKQDEELVQKYDEERLKLSEEREKKDEEEGVKRGQGREKKDKGEYRKEKFHEGQDIKRQREQRKSAAQSRQLFEQQPIEQSRQPQRRGENKERWNKRQRQQNLERRNKFEGRNNDNPSRYNDRENKYEKRNRSEGDWNDRNKQTRGYQRRDDQNQEYGKREYKRNDFDRNDRNDKGNRNYNNRERYDRNDRGQKDYQRGNKFQKREFNYERQDPNTKPRYQREQREQGGYQQRTPRFNNNEDRPQRQYEQKPQRRSLDNLYQSADFQNKSFERGSGFNKETEGNYNRRPIPSENELNAFEGSFNATGNSERPRQGRRAVRGGRGTREE